MKRNNFLVRGIGLLSLLLMPGLVLGQVDLLKNLTQPAPSALSAEPSAEELPDPELAFIPSIQQQDHQTLLAIWDIQSCCYLYRKRFKFESLTAGIELGEPRFPDGMMIEDAYFGLMEIYRQQVKIEIPIQRSTTTPTQLELQASFQGCADIGVCYPPQQQVIPVMLSALTDTGPPATGSNSGTTLQTTPPAPTSASVMVSEQDRMANMLTAQRLWALPAFFGFGLLLAFTPCVFPMIPILSSIIIGQGNQLTQFRAFTLSLIYVLAMAMTYSLAGVIAGLVGENIQIWFQNPWVIASFSAVFVLLSLSMFGFYELQIPTSWQTRLNALSNHQSGGVYSGVAIMGVLSALIVGPCVAPPLIGALTVIGTTGDAVLGGLALFALSLGMGMPLLLIGTSAGRWLPKSGAWMSMTKAIFGVLMLAVAIWMLERILPEVISMLLWATLFIVCAVYMGALQPVSGPGWRTLSKGLGVVLLAYGVLLLVGVAAGGRDTLQPLRGVLLAGNTPATYSELEFRYIKTVNDLDQTLRQTNGQPVMLDFYADWCVSCKEMERFTFSDSAVQAVLNQAILLKADVTANDAEDQALLRRFNLIGPPATLFFGFDGSERSAYRVVGFMPAERFKNHAQQALQSDWRTTNAYRTNPSGISEISADQLVWSSDLPTQQ